MARTALDRVSVKIHLLVWSLPAFLEQTEDVLEKNTFTSNINYHGRTAFTV